MLKRLRVELVPVVGDLREVRMETEKLRKQREADGFSWAVFVALCRGLGVLWRHGRAGVAQVISETAGLAGSGKTQIYRRNWMELIGCARTGNWKTKIGATAVFGLLG